MKTKPKTIQIDAKLLEDVAHLLNRLQCDQDEMSADVQFSEDEKGTFWALIEALPEQVRGSVIN